MQTDVLSRFRDGLAKKAFTLTQIQEATNIPLATLSDMSDASWRPKIFDRFERLEAALSQIEGAAAEAGAETGRATNAA